MRKRGKGWQADAVDKNGVRIRKQFKTKKAAAEFERDFQQAGSRQTRNQKTQPHRRK